jgi:hypothetical protein
MVVFGLVGLVGCLVTESEASDNDKSHKNGGINHDGYEPEFSDGFFVHLVGFVWLVCSALWARW